MDVVRFGVSISSELLESFDKLIRSKGYVNRSEAIRDLIRSYLVEHEWEEGVETIGSVTIVYDHHVHDLTETLTEIQHEHYDMIISSMHVHIDQHNCLEVIVIRGQSSKVKDIANRLISTKGVKHGRLTMTTTGKNIV